MVSVLITFAIGVEGAGILIEHEDRKPSTNDLIRGVYVASVYLNDDPQHKEGVVMKNIRRLWVSDMASAIKTFVK